MEDTMTYFKLHLIRILTTVIVEVCMIILWFRLMSIYKQLTSAYFLLSISVLFLADGFVIKKFKKDLFDDKYKGSTSYYAFKFFYYIDFIVGIPMLIATIVTSIVSGIGFH